MTSGRVVGLCRTFQGRILDALGSSMVMRHDGSNIGLAMLLHCSHELCAMIKHFPPIDLGTALSAVPRSLGDRWLRRNGSAECIAAGCGYALRVGANTHSDIMTSISVPQMRDFAFVFPKRTVS